MTKSLEQPDLIIRRRQRERRMRLIDQGLPVDYDTLDRRKQHEARLRSLGLPNDYFDLSKPAQLAARISSLRSWYDEDKPRVFCTDPKAFVRACRLWAEFYMKPAEWNRGVYSIPDPLHKYQMVSMACARPLTENQCAKSVCHAPRGSAKTQTLIHELVSMVAVVRTHRIDILVAEQTAERTEEEMRKLRLQIERNECIHRDFGGPEVLTPMKRVGTGRWNDTTLNFAHNSATVIGRSVNSAQRGRRPLWGIIDDPEDEEISRNEGWREKYMRWLFKTWMPMFVPGSATMWIGTVIHEFSCLQMALRGVRETKSLETDEAIMDRDERFDDWQRRHWLLIEDHGTDDAYSIWPERYGVEDFDRYVRTYGLSSAMAEFQGRPVGSGQFCLVRNPDRHGYMRCESKEGDYMLDFCSSEKIPWNKFVQTLHVVAGCDIADSIRPSADPAAIVFVGADPSGVVYVLDCFTKRMHADSLVRKAFEMDIIWQARKMMWEKNGLQSAICRYARQYAYLLNAKGVSVPIQAGLDQNAASKTRRILAALTPLFHENRIRFPFYATFTDIEGTVHSPTPGQGVIYNRALQEQVDTFTDEGSSGHDDAIDALEMAIRGLGRSRGVLPHHDPDPMQTQLNDLLDVGIEIPDHMLRVEDWPKRLVDRARNPLAGIMADLGEYEDLDPYD